MFPINERTENRQAKRVAGAVASATLLVAVSAPTTAWSRDEFLIAALRCEGVRCTTAEGIMPRRLTTVEITGAGAAPGAGLQLQVSNSRSRDVVLERGFGAFAAGNFTASIPAYRFEDGQYRFVVSTSNGSIVGSGSFSIAAASAMSAGKPATKPPEKSPRSSLLGNWYGINGTVATVELRGNGSYLWAGSNAGTWRREGNEIVFTGTLAAWNSGRGKLNQTADVLEFYWTNREGAKQYFVLQKY